MSAAQQIIAFAAAAHILPSNVRADALRLLADSLAVGAAGAASHEAQLLLPAIGRWGASAESRLLQGSTMPAPSAAFFHGFAIHCLEWDAVHEGAVVHALSVVTAALLATSDRMGGCNSNNFLTALAVGVDIASGIGLSATGPMRFFRPATAGIIGASLAVARLEGLPADKYADVLGLAYSSLSGTMQAHVEASIALPLQIANAARAAIIAVDLARCGMDGPKDILNGPFGYSQLIEPLELTQYTANLGKIWRISEVSTKPFPSGRASHGGLAALQQMRADGLMLDDVSFITLSAPALIQRLVGRPYMADATPAYARLCFAFLAPLMLRDGHIDPRCFTRDKITDPALAALAARVHITQDDNPNGNALGPQMLIVQLQNGETRSHPILASLGSPQAPMNPQQSAHKYALCQELAQAGQVDDAGDPRLFSNPLAYATEPK